MRFLVDECTGPSVALWLKSQGHDVFSVFDMHRGMTDDEVMKKCLQENWTLITNDKDFGEKAFREGILHRGVILLRLEDESTSSKINVISKLLHSYSDKIGDSFVVVTEKQVRFAHK
jgi:predicted nuclease of predicted toxin-antitoxin system